MHRQAAVTGALVLSVAIIVTTARALGGAQFGPAQAAGSATAAPALDASAIVDLPETMHIVSVVEPAAVAAPAPASAATAPSEEPAPASAAIATAPRTPAPVVRTPAPVVAAAPVAPAPVAPAPVTTTCPAGSWFCYPRLGISGAIVPYSDCTGSTDVGTQIRSFTCLSNSYLMAHAYTQFGKITGWQAGDTVIAYGRTFTVTGAFVQSACTQPRMPLAPLEMQTSLTPYSCGDVLVVQAN